VIVRFVRPVDPAKAGDEAADFLTANPDVQGTFTEREVPATGIKSA
jgi:ribose transport system substrate-binding protein